MNQLLHDGVVGIVVGIITSALMYLAKVFWDNKVTPFLRATRYQGVKIDGPWIGKSKDDNHESEVRLFLNQNAHELQGSMLFSFKSKEKEFTIDFNVNGYMWEGYITLNFLPKDKRVTSYATALLKLHGGGGVLVGQFSFRNVEQEIVTTISMVVSRDIDR